MWQKCPICNGEGKIPNYGISSSMYSVCPTCNGARIISELTGSTPITHQIIVNTDVLNFEKDSNSDFRDKDYSNPDVDIRDKDYFDKR